MSTVNPFDLLGDDDNDDPLHLIAAARQQKAKAKAVAAAAAKKPAAAAPAADKLPTKPAPPAQALREARNATASETARGGRGRGALGRGRGGRGAGSGPNREFENGNMNSFSPSYDGQVEDGEGKPSERVRESYGPPRQSFRGGRRGGYANVEGEAAGDSERPPRRIYERRSGNGRGYEMKREGAGRGNWGTATDDVIAQETEENVNADEKVAAPEKQKDSGDEQPDDSNKDTTANKTEEKEAEDKEMTLAEYEKIREEKRKALLAMKCEERKVNFDKEFDSMQRLSIKKGTDEIFIKLGSDKEEKKENADREERGKKALSINEFLKPAEGEMNYNAGGRGRGRGRGDRAQIRGNFGGGSVNHPVAPEIEDPRQFPMLGGK
ncbi:RGG repeats nuclear RNA binding protein A-like [Iris pallida]|uniref:RGG repeats nuclear RNA binding protein A-like n=1 Tax=Iris pallida TaxID=29817 RepID=A0AAX6EM75_IRIPA|nr:RGG repeats nuclear RNA binding protein A-like [Iris pallida]